MGLVAGGEAGPQGEAVAAMEQGHSCWDLSLGGHRGADRPC